MLTLMARWIAARGCAPSPDELAAEQERARRVQEIQRRLRGIDTALLLQSLRAARQRRDRADS